jgi:hypothetical protein
VQTTTGTCDSYVLVHALIFTCLVQNLARQRPMLSCLATQLCDRVRDTAQIGTASLVALFVCLCVQANVELSLNSFISHSTQSRLTKISVMTNSNARFVSSPVMSSFVCTGALPVDGLVCLALTPVWTTDHKIRSSNTQLSLLHIMNEIMMMIDSCNV